jgi:hypothetical protein
VWSVLLIVDGGNAMEGTWKEAIVGNLKQKSIFGIPILIKPLNFL